MNLQIEWQKEAKKVAENNGYVYAEAEDYANGFEVGAQSYANAVEALLKADIDRFKEKIENPNAVQEERNHFKVMYAYTNGLMQKLTELTPTSNE